MPSLLLHPEIRTDKDFLPITGTDYLELYVGNARQAAYFYRAAFGMSLVACAGRTTGLRDRASYVVQQGDIRLVLTTPLRPDGGIADHVHRHGDGVRDVALTVEDAKFAWRESVKRGARSIHECHDLMDEHGRVRLASVAAYGDTIHTFVERDHYYGPFLPGYESVDCDPLAQPVGLTHIDHIAATVGWNELRRWIDYYSDTLGFSPWTGKRDDSSRYASSHSTVVSSARGRVLFPIHEPLDARNDRGRAKSAIEEYLESYHGPGVHRIALATSDIAATVAAMKRQGVEFASVPQSYYRLLSGRLGKIDESVEDLRRLGILVSRDGDGYLLQASTRPVEDRPTLHFEVVQRKGSWGFGEDNVDALAEAVEAEERLFGYPPKQAVTYRQEL